MLKNIKLSNPKSVSFNVKSFCVPTKKANQRKHTIYAAYNCGFAARNQNLQSGNGIQRLSMTTMQNANELSETILRQIDATTVKRIFCFSTHQGNTIVNAMISVTEKGVYYSPLFGTLLVLPIAGDFTNFDCFAYSFSKDTDYIFAANSNGIYVADKSLLFKPLSQKLNAKQMIVFDNRLFVLDTSCEQIHFSAPLDLCDFGAESGLAGSLKVDETLGKILSLDVYNNKLLLICENGFRTLETAYDPSKFRLTELARSYESIIPNTARVLGDTIFFLTRGGMCKAVKGQITLLDTDFDFDSYQGEAQSIVYDNRYFLSFNKSGGSVSEQCKNNTLLVIEKFLDSQTIYENIHIRSFERVFNEHCSRLAVLTDDTSYIYQIDKSAAIGEMPIEKVWQSDFFSLTYAATNQYIRQVLIKTSGDIDVVVMNNRTEQKISLRGAAEVQKVNLNFKGETFRLKIISREASAYISLLTVVIGFNSGNAA